jgi:alpha-amylase
VLRRRPERYHAALRAHEAADAARAEAAAAEVAAGGSITSIHEIVHSKESNLSALLNYDPYERRSGLVRFLAPAAGPEAFANSVAEELGDFVDQPFTLTNLAPGRLVVARDGNVRTPGGAATVRVEKRLTLGGDRLAPSLGLEVAVTNRSSLVIEARLGVEWSITMLGGGGNPAAWWEVGGERSAHDARGAVDDVRRLAQGNDYIGIAIETTASPAASAWWSPIETVSNSEAGFERVYQGSALLLSWPLRLRPGEEAIVRVDHLVSATRDHAAEETATTATGA